MKIGIVGGGSIGLLTACLLVENGHEVTLYVRRQSQKVSIDNNGLVLYPYRHYQIEVRLVGQWEQDEFLFICTKQYHLEKILPIIDKKQIDKPLVFMQNGMGHVDIVSRIGLENDIVLATCEYGAMKLNDYTVQQKGKGKINIALYQGSTNVLQKLNQLNGTDLPIETNCNWYTMLARKLIINAVINPITSLFQVKNGEIYNNSYLRKLAEQTCFEASNVLGLDSNEEWENVLRVIKQTAENESSMKLDIKHGRKTEIDAILGYLLRHASGETPYIRYAYLAIKVMEEREKGDSAYG
jgi:2-dehydropantoate 2-reductase